MSKSIGLKLIYGTLVALLLTFSTTAAFAQDQLQEVAPEATATVPQPTDPPPTNTPVPVITNTPVPVPTNTPVPVPPTPIPPTAVPPVTEPSANSRANHGCALRFGSCCAICFGIKTTQESVSY